MKKVLVFIIGIMISISFTGCSLIHEKPDKAVEEKDVIEKIEIVTLPKKTIYIEEEPGELDIDGLIVLVTMTNKKAIAEDVRDKNTKEKGTYEISSNIDYDNAGEYNVSVKRKGFKSGVSFKVRVLSKEITYSEEKRADDYSYNSRISYYLNDKLMYIKQVNDSVFYLYDNEIYRLDLKTGNYIKNSLNEIMSSEYYTVLSVAESDKYIYFHINYYDEELSEYKNAVVVFDKNLNFIKELKFEFNGGNYSIYSIKNYKGKIYFDLYANYDYNEFFELDEETFNLKSIYKPYSKIDFIINDNLFFEGYSSFYEKRLLYKYSMETKRKKLISTTNSYYNEKYVVGDYIYLLNYYRNNNESSCKLQKISYDGKERYTYDIELPYIYNLYFTDKEIYFSHYNESEGEAITYLNLEGNKTITLNEENKYLKNVREIYSFERANYIIIGKNNGLYLLQFKNIDDLLEYNGDKTKLIKLK